jgi:glycosyltransferase involved in cell wall biosynthesis
MISVIVPVRDEEHSIAACVAAVASALKGVAGEILVVDGASTDGTQRIVQELCLVVPGLRLLENPDRITSAGMNIGIQASTGKYILIVGGHTRLDENYVERCAEVLDNMPEVGCAGGRTVAVNHTPLGKAIALAMSDRFGVGGVAFRCSDKPGYVDTVAFGMYRREVFSTVGLFDLELVRNQDDELNYRLTRAGYKVFMDPETRSWYSPRATLRKLWKQYFDYGFWKVRLMQKHRSVPSWRHLVPGAFVAVLVGTASAAPFNDIAALAFGTVIACYSLAACAAAAAVSRKDGWRYFPLLPAIFATLHISYGTGFLKGAAQFLLLGRGSRKCTVPSLLAGQSDNAA